MEHYVEQLFEQKTNDEILGENYDENNAFILFYPVDKFYKPESDQVDTIHIYVSHCNTEAYDMVVKKFGYPNKETRYERKWEIPYDFPEVVQYGNKFAFNGVMLECEQEDDGYYVIPSFLKKEFRKAFPNVCNVARKQTLQSVDYNGEFPVYCSGDTILEFENCKITTKILSCGGAYVFEYENPTPVKWGKNVPSILSEIEEEILEKLEVYDYTFCCGGCE